MSGIWYDCDFIPVTRRVGLTSRTKRNNLYEIYQAVFAAFPVLTLPAGLIMEKVRWVLNDVYRYQIGIYEVPISEGKARSFISQLH